MSDEIKYCKFCNKEKPIKEFVKSGFAIKNICRECQNKKQAQIYRDSKKVKELEKENQELKKQLSNSHQIKVQQKEFIEWLEEKIKNYELPLTDENKKALGYTLPMKGIYKEILEKYKEIVGDKNEIQDE